jgi:hypothetical protein
MTEMTIDNETFNDLVKPLVGMTISHPWRGYGSAVFFELGLLCERMVRRREQKYGEACIDIQWDWRLESDFKVVCGSSNSAPDIESHIRRLIGMSIAGITTLGRPSELTVELSNGLRLRSMAMVTGDPQWAIRLKDGTWLSCVRGCLVADDGTEGERLSEEEIAVSDRAAETAKRWGRPLAEPVHGQCRDCSHFVRLDGDFELLDYGACTSSISPFDGRITNLASGCPAFCGPV